MSLINQLEQYLTRLDVIQKGDHIVLAVSGGRDSMVMLHLFDALKKKWKFELIVAHINHKLRGDESDADEKFVRMTAHSLKIHYESAEVDVRSGAREKKTSIQNAARILRYEVLEEMRTRSEARWIATAHHAGDNTETILAHLFRGSGVEGMQGMKPVRDHLLRPLLFATSKNIQVYAEEKKIKWREDSSNQHDDYTRNVLRHHVIPKITELINPGIDQTLSQSSFIFQSLGEFLQHHIDRLAAEAISRVYEELSLAIPILKRYFDYEKFAVIQHAIRTFYHRESSYSEIIAIHSLLNSDVGKGVVLKNGEKVFRERDAVIFTKSSRFGPAEISFQIGETVEVDQYHLSIQPIFSDHKRFTSDPDIEYIDSSSVGTSWTLRPWKKGDWFIPLGVRGKQKVSDFLINNKVPRYKKDDVLILETNDTIVWVCGMRLDDRFKITNKTRSVLELRLTSVIDHE